MHWDYIVIYHPAKNPDSVPLYINLISDEKLKNYTKILGYDQNL